MFGWLKRKQPENSISTSQQLLEYLRSVQGAMSEAGESVNTITAMEDPTVFACVKVLAESVAQIPLNVMRKTTQGSEIVFNSDAYQILKRRPNGWMTPRQFRRLLVARTAAEGNFIAIKNRVRGRVFELLPVSNNRVTVEQDDRYEVTYKVETNTGTRIYPKEDIFHYYSLSLDGVSGLNPIELHKTHIGLSLALDKFGARLFKNGAHPRIILGTDNVLKEDDMKRIIASFQAQTGGEKAHSTHILDGGFKPHRMTLTAEEAQFNETRKLMRSILAALWRVPPHMINDLDKATFSNIENLARQFVDYALMPWLVDLEEVYSYQLLTERERDLGYFIKHNVNGLLRGDAAARAQYYTAALGSLQQPGWMTPNEIRGLEDMDEGPEELNQYMVPSQEPEEPEEPEPEPEPQEEEENATA
jgi:HK97 family phage portal protein